jgi:hypothetical protein
MAPPWTGDEHVCSSNIVCLGRIRRLTAEGHIEGCAQHGAERWSALEAGIGPARVRRGAAEIGRVKSLDRRARAAHRVRRTKRRGDQSGRRGPGASRARADRGRTENNTSLPRLRKLLKSLGSDERNQENPNEGGKGGRTGRKIVPTFTIIGKERLWAPSDVIVRSPQTS